MGDHPALLMTWFKNVVERNTTLFNECFQVSSNVVYKIVTERLHLSELVLTLSSKNADCINPFDFT